MNDLLVS